MVAPRSQDYSDERGKQGQRRRLAWYQRVFLVSLIAFACFSAASLATPKEAQAASGWYETPFTDGTVHWCFYNEYSWGYSIDGCQFYYGGYIYYDKYSTDQVLILLTNGQYMDQTQYWRQSSQVSYVISFNTGSSAFDLIPQLAGASGCAVGYTCWALQPGSSQIPENSRTTNAPPDSVTTEEPQAVEVPVGPQTVQAKEAPPGATQTATTAQAQFPHEVSQDNSSSFAYDEGWKQVRTSKAQGGTYRVSSSKSRIATFEAAGYTDAGGSTMELITATGPRMGKAKVQVVNLASAEVVKQVTFDLQTRRSRYKVEKTITGLTPHEPYGLVIRSANGRPVAVDAVGYEAHGNMCHSVVN